MNGTSICEVCSREFKWIRAKSQTVPRVCSKECSNKLPRDWVKKKFREDLEFIKANYKKRFDEKVIKKEGCWDWKGCQHHSGYLPFKDHKRKNDFAHRASWRIHNGEIPKASLVLHKCDNKRCTNPEHLFLGTHKDNTRDMHEKGRGNYGEKHHKCVLSEEEVKEIKNLLRLGVKSTRIAEDYGVTDGTIWFIAHKKTWKHLE